MHYECFVIVLHAYLFQYVFNQEISFLPMEHVDSRSNCTVTDDFVFVNSIANFTGLNLNYSFISVTYELNKTISSDRVFLFEHDLKEPCENDETDKYKCYTIEREVVRFSLKFPADKNHYQVKVIGKLNINSTTISVAVQDFPDIIDTINVTSELMVNKNIISTNNDCQINITVSDLTIQFVCEHHSKPCLIEMTINEARSIYGLNQVQFKETARNNGKIIRIAIKYAACRMDRKFKTLSCIITADTDYSTLVLNPWKRGAFIFAAMIILTNIGVYYFYCYYRLEKQTSKKRKSLHEFESDSTKNENIDLGNNKTQRDKSQSYLHKVFTKCKKDSSHKGFIAFQDFEVSDLHQKDRNIYDFIHLTAKLTVRLAVCCNSPHRLKEFNNPHERSSAEFLRFGSGLVSDVVILQYEQGNYNVSRCPCQKCIKSKKPKENWGILKVTTANFIVYDDTEAEKTICRFFFESKKSPLIILRGWKIESTSKEEGRCVLRLETCDSDLLKKLLFYLNSWHENRNDINKKYASSNCVFIVSHPHGCPMYVSLGNSINRFQLIGSNKILTSYTYTTSTCDGCTGAYVHFLGINVDTVHGPHIHCGVNKSGLNYCSIGHEKGFTNVNTTKS